MKNCKKHFVVALIVLFMGHFLAPSATHAQIVEVGGSVGLSYYMGDINPKIPFVESRLGWGALARYYENTRWAFRFTYSNLQLDCSDKASNYRPERGLSFHTNVHDVALIAEFNFLDYFTGSKRNGLSPYLFGGISALFFNPKADDGTSLHDKLTDVGYYEDDEKGEIKMEIPDKSTSAVSIPFGMGVKCSIGQKIGIALEWRWDYTFTDWLDDCHAYYPRINDQYSDPTGFSDGSQYVQRGNKYDNDWFGYLNFSLTYKFRLPTGKNCNTKERYNNY